MGDETSARQPPSCPAANGEELILRDHLAIDRTVLANERTLMAYVRTGLAFFIAAAGLLHFFPETYGQVLGWALVPAGIVTLALGAWRYRKMQCGAIAVRRNDPFSHDK